MKQNEQARFDGLYQQYLTHLKLQGHSDSTIDVYARAVRRIAVYFDCCPDQLSIEQLTSYFADLVDSYSWSTIKMDRNGRRVRDYGFLHGNAKARLALLQLILQVLIKAKTPRKRPNFICPKCQTPMRIIGFIKPA